MSHIEFDRSLAPYLRKVYEAPMMAAEEEYNLACRWRDHQDRQAADRLVTSHLRLVAKIARGHRGYGLPLADLISEGNLGLMRAIKGFDPERGYRFSTYAIWWINAAIQEYILHSWSLVKMGTTAAQKKLFFNLGRLKRQLQAMDDGDLSPEVVKSIAVQLCVPEDEIVGMNRRLAGMDESLNSIVTQFDSGHSAEWMDLLVDETPDQESVISERTELCHRRRLVGEALEELSPRERDVIRERRLKDRRSTLGELGKRYGISRESVRLIEGRALQKLRKAVGTSATA